MSNDPVYSSDVAMTPTVKAVQDRKGSRCGYAKMEQRGSWETRITPDLAAFIGRQISVFLGTANAAGQPYVQHRAALLDFSRYSTRARLPSRTSSETASTSRKEILRRIPRPSCS